MTARTITVSWECPACGHRHKWTWDAADATENAITMHCDMCRSTTKTRLVQIGRRVWAALWPGR